jgi:hypothetical protein
MDWGRSGCRLPCHAARGLPHAPPASRSALRTPALTPDRDPRPPPPINFPKVLRSMKVVGTEDVVVGQYRARNNLPGYLDDATVPKGR